VLSSGELDLHQDHGDPAAAAAQLEREVDAAPGRHGRAEIGGDRAGAVERGQPRAAGVDQTGGQYGVAGEQGHEGLVQGGGHA
jgi:hypothetical protein